VTPIDDYIAQWPPRRRERGATVHRQVSRLFPAAVCSLRYRMPTCALNGAFLARRNRKSCLSLYTCTAGRIRAFKDRHPGQRPAAGCLQFRDRDPFPVEEIEIAVVRALAPDAHLRAREGRA